MRDTRPPVLALPAEPKPRRNKYNARAVDLCGEHFDSEAEARRYLVLLAEAVAGEIRQPVRRQVRYVLQDGFRAPDGRRVRAITWTADFVYETRDGRTVAEDVKGGRATLTQQSRLRHKLFVHRYPEIELRIVEM